MSPGCLAYRFARCTTTTPSGCSSPPDEPNANYRLYTDADLLRLQQIVIGRELGFSLDEIKRSLDDPRFDQRQALVEQRRRLEEKARTVDEMLRAVDAALAVAGHDPQGGTMDMKELFGGFDPSVHEAEVEARWSGPALDESRRRVKNYTADDWKRWKAENATLPASGSRRFSRRRFARTPAGRSEDALYTSSSAEAVPSVPLAFFIK